MRAADMRAELEARSADAVSVARCALGIGAFVALAMIGSPRRIVGIVIVTAVVAAVALDGLDGWLARRYGTASAGGSYLDVLSDRLTEYSAWLFAAPLYRPWMALVLLIVLRHVAVDGIKLLAAARGKSMRAGIHVTGWRAYLIHSLPSRLSYNAVKATSLGAIAATYALSGAFRTVATVAIALHIVPCWIRASGSFMELPRFLRDPREPPSSRNLRRYGFQATLAVVALGVCITGANMYALLPRIHV
jgi:phosphatidylglycerophosphate synthase